MIDRVAFISEHASPLAMLGGVDAGGQNVYIDSVARQLAERGINVDIYTRWTDAQEPRVIEYAPGVRVVHVKAGPLESIPKEELFPYMDEFAAGMRAFIAQQRLHYDVMHAHFWMSGYVAVLLKDILRVPFAVTFHALGKVRRMHQGENDGFPDARFRIEEMVVREADALVAECPQDREDLLIHYYADDRKVTVIPCGFDRAEFKPLDKAGCAQQIGIPNDGRTILQLGRMVPRKGVDNVIRALAVLSRDSVKARLLVVGGEADQPDPELTPEIGRLMRLAEELDVAEQVIFVGRRSREQLKLYYNAADIFVSTPWYEPFGITILEAMACGLPVVGSNVGGIKFSVMHDNTGFLVPPADPEILAARLKVLLLNPSLRRFFANNALARVNERFTWGKVAGRLVNLYAELSRIQDEHGIACSPENPVKQPIEYLPSTALHRRTPGG